MQLFSKGTIALTLITFFVCAGVNGLVNLFVQNDTISYISNLAAVDTNDASTTSSGDYVGQSSSDYSSPSPIASIVSPTDNSVVSGTITITVTSQNSGTFSSLQLFVSGSPLNQGVSNPQLPYTYSWDSTQVPDGPYTLSAVGSSNAGGYTTATITIIVNNSTNSGNTSNSTPNSSNNSNTSQPSITPPAIYSVSASSITGTGATISWVTDQLSDSQVIFGTGSTRYTTPLDSNFVTAHAEFITGLQPGTSYYYVVLSNGVGGGSAHSASYNFTTPQVSSDNVTPSSGYSNPSNSTVTYHRPLPPLPPTKISKNLKLNDSGAEVLLLQKTLNALGFTIATTGPDSPGKETSRFDVPTQKAVIQYQSTQSSSGIIPSGTLDNVTISLINSDINRLRVEAESTSSASSHSTTDTESPIVRVLNTTFNGVSNLWITLFAKIK